MDVKKLAAAAALCAGVATSSNALTLGNILNEDGLNDVHDTGASYVHLTDRDGKDDSAIAYLLLELAGNASDNTFGIFDTDSSGNQHFLEIFGGVRSQGAVATIEFDLSSKTATYGKDEHGAGISVYNDGTFGFYIGTSAGKFLSDASLNDGDYDYSLLFNTDGIEHDRILGSQVVVAFEDLPFPGADKDFNDMVVGVTDVTPAPLPAGVLLLGAGVAGLGALRKKLSAKPEGELALA